MNYKILNTVGEIFAEEGKKVLSELGEAHYLSLTQEKLEEIIGDYDIIFVQLGLNITKSVIDKALNLKVIATATTGLDHIDVEYAKSKSIPVISLRGEDEFLRTVTGTAELAFGLIIDLLRFTPFAFDSVKNYEWDRERFRGHNLYGKTLGIVGLGRLGKLMASYANGFKMKVLAVDPNISEEEMLKFNCEKVDFETLLAQSDVISIHVHLMPETENMFNAPVFSKMKKTAYLINTARGKIVNESDLLRALENKEIAGYAADVLSDELNFENGFDNHPLVGYAKNNNNLIIVPHIGGMTIESREATDIFIAQKLKNFLNN